MHETCRLRGANGIARTAIFCCVFGGRRRVSGGGGRSSLAPGLFS